MIIRRTVLSAGIGLAFFFVLLAGFAALRPSPSAALAGAAISAPAGEAAPPEEEGGYLVQTVDNEICVFQKGRLVLHTGVYAAMLPQQDREALETGISVPDEVALTVLLEDLGS